ncbi:MAG: hypothetical protein NT062_25895 [Proteobacteria bacterium]|nr:hypothetical protein [Pseudomonadota bacterium]
MRRSLVVGAVASLATGAVADPGSEALLARSHALAVEVSKVRGLPLKHPVGNEVIDQAELRLRLAKFQTDDPARVAATEAEGRALQRWGLIPLGADYGALVLGVQGDQIAGYYDAKTKALTIVGDPQLTADAWPELVLAHELDHALQDQSFDLERYRSVPPTETGDGELARQAVVEGDGLALMIELLLARTQAASVPSMWMNPQVAEMIQKDLSIPGDGDALDRAPLVVREEMLFPYRAGFGFVAALRRHQPWSAVDAAFARPPRSTEQILHPERYLADELPIPIEITMPAALPGYAIAHSTVWGEFGFDVFLRSHRVAAIAAAEASEGWGGDRALLVTSGRHAVGISRSEWDSEADAIEAAEALIRAIDDEVIGGSITHSPSKTSWLALDGTTAWVERRGSSVVVVIGAPAYAANDLATEAWTISKISKIARVGKRGKPR